MTSGGDNHFGDFPENQLTTDFALICKLAWGNATVSPFPLVMISFGGTRPPDNTTAQMLNANMEVLIMIRLFIQVFIMSCSGCDNAPLLWPTFVLSHFSQGSTNVTVALPE